MISVVGAIGLLVAAIVLAVARALVAEEIRGWQPHLRQALLRRACRRLPDGHRERYQEEWGAMLADCSDRPLTALKNAISLLVHARVIARELRPQAVAASSQGSTAKVSVARRASRGLTLAAAVMRLMRALLLRISGGHIAGQLGRLIRMGLVPFANVAVDVFREFWRTALETLRSLLAVLVDRRGSVVAALFIGAGVASGASLVAFLATLLGF
jgi:hypothetical protein